MATVLCAGCFGRPPSFVLPKDGGPAWHELGSRHFQMYTNGDVDDAEDVLASLEQTQRLLEQAILAGHAQLELRTRVIAFRSEDELEDFTGVDAGGVYMRKLPSDLDGMPTLLIPAEPDRFHKALFAHELAHRLNDVALGAIPVWLEEGLAEYYATVRDGGGQPVVGDPDPLLNVAQGMAWAVPSKLIVKGMPVEIPLMPTASQVMAQTRQEFYLWDKSSSEHSAQRRKHYGTAAALVHMLLHGGSSQSDVFRDGLAQARAGEGERLRAVLDELDRTRLDAELAAYMRSALVWRQAHQPAPPAVPGITRRQMSRSETLLLWAQIGGFAGPFAQRSEDFVRLAELDEPENVEVQYWAGRMAMVQGDPAAAVLEFRSALQGNPRHAASWLALAVLYHHPNMSSKWPEAELVELQRDALEGLRPVAETAIQLDLLAAAQYRARRFAEAEDHALRAVALAPDCWHCYHTLAAISQAMGSPDLAVTYEEYALDRLNERTAPRVARLCAETLQRYRTQLHEPVGRDVVVLDIPMFVLD